MPQAASLFEIVETPSSVDEVVARLADPGVGAVTTFVGLVRNTTDNRQVRYLEYEAYHDMAVASFAAIATEIRERWPEVRSIAMVHRVGRLEVGDTAVVLALSAAHRRQVFDALRFAIDRVKQVSPIWKKEVWADGSAWRSEG